MEKERINLVKGYYALISREEYSLFNDIEDLLGDCSQFSISTFHRNYSITYNDYLNLDKQDSLEDVYDILKENKCLFLNIRAYEHGGITISTSTGYPYNDRWDSGLFGIIYCRR